VSKRRTQLVLLIGMTLILLSGCTIFNDETLPTGAAIINTKQKPVDIIIKTNEKYKNMQDFKAIKIINNDNGAMKEVIMVKEDRYRINRESFEKKNEWYVKNKVTEISNGNKVWITKTFESSTIREVEKILEKEIISGSQDVYIRLGKIYNGLGKVEEAEEMFKKAISSPGPKDSEGMFELGLLYKNQERIKESEEMIRKASKTWRRTHFLIPSVNDYLIGAQDALKEIKKMYPDYHGQYIDSGFDMVDIDVTLSLGVISGVIVPNCPECDPNSITGLTASNIVDVAKEILKNAIELMPNNEEFYLGLGWVYGFQGDTREGEEIFKKVLAINPFNERALIGLSDIYMQRGDFEEAKATVEKIINTYPNNRDAYLRLGELSLILGDEKEAEEMFKKAIDINPSNHMTYYFIGESYSFSNVGKSEEMFEKTFSLKPDNVEMICACRQCLCNSLLSEKLGWVYLKQGKFNDAEEMFKRNLKINRLPTYEVKEEDSYDEIQYIDDILDFNQYNFILKQNKNFYLLEGKKMKNTALWSKIKAEINKEDFSITKLEFYKGVDGKEKLMKSIIYENISFDNDFDDKEFAIIEG